MWVENEARRANRNLLVVNGTIAVVAVLILTVNFRYCANFVRGCEPISSGELISLQSPDQRWRNFVAVNGDKVAKAGYRDVERRTENGRVVSSEVKDEYIFLQLGDKILLVKAPPGEARLAYSGQLIPTNESVQTDFLRPFAAREPELGAMVLPFTLDAVDYRDEGYLIFLVVMPLLALAIWNILKAVRRSSEVQSSPAWKAVSAFGDVNQLSAQIESELIAGGPRKFGKLQMTPQWIVRRKLFSTWVSPVADLVWIYKKVTKHSVNFIPTGKTYSVILVGRHKQRTEEQMKEKMVNELLVELANRVPFALFGFDKNLEQAWRKNPQSVIASVDARIQQAKSQAAAAGAAAPAK